MSDSENDRQQPEFHGETRPEPEPVVTGYHVWVQIEVEYEDEEHDDVGLPDKLATFDTLEEAEAFVRTLPGWTGPVNDPRTSDYRERVQS